MNEFELIERYFARAPKSASVRLGVGDDAAVIAPSAGCELVMSVDMLVEGRHFLAGTDPEALGHKTLAVNLSDMAAMGATPRWVLLAGALPQSDPPWVEAFAKGFHALAARFDCDLVGGDTTMGPRNFCVTIIGEVPAGMAITRGGAKPGDDIYVSGTLGDAALALAALDGRTKLDAATLVECRARLEKPAPRIAQGIGLRGIASACIDISDGLTGDLGHILERSHAGAVVDLASIPASPSLRRGLASGERALALECLLAGGDDYELCFTAPPAMARSIAAIAAAENVPMTRIGTITGGNGLIVRDEHGVALPSLPRAFDHFRKDALK